MSKNRVIGKNGALPWSLKGDLKFFKEKTWNGNVIMGRKTYESLPNGFLNMRTIWVVTHENKFGWLQASYNKFGRVSMVNILTNFNDLPDGSYWVAGGLSMYQDFMPKISEFFVTYINQEYEGDVVMPAFEEKFPNSETVLTTPDFEIKRFYGTQEIVKV